MRNAVRVRSYVRPLDAPWGASTYYLVRFVILPGQAHDLAGVPELPGDPSFGALIGDRASGAGWLLAEIEESGAMAVIPARRNRTVPRHHDRWGGHPLRTAPPCARENASPAAREIDGGAVHALPFAFRLQADRNDAAAIARPRSAGPCASWR